jgi:hypothetical protein
MSSGSSKTLVSSVKLLHNSVELTLCNKDNDDDDDDDDDDDKVD